ncbi:MAG: hypothetical protein JRN40_02865 [Nitrososphaerota archaeon]|nr:hypothetical protein [Nitrososphaerota archaeon]
MTVSSEGGARLSGRCAQLATAKAAEAARFLTGDERSHTEAVKLGLNSALQGARRKCALRRFLFLGRPKSFELDDAPRFEVDKKSGIHDPYEGPTEPDFHRRRRV